jgi:hypothetical protein
MPEYRRAWSGLLPSTDDLPFARNTVDRQIDAIAKMQEFIRNHRRSRTVLFTTKDTK